jgi:hypothetical protein
MDSDFFWPGEFYHLHPAPARKEEEELLAVSS